MRKPVFRFPTRSETNWAVQPQTMTRGLKFRIKEVKDCTICVVKTNALISCAVTAQLICAFFFAYVKSRFTQNAAQMIIAVPGICKASLSKVRI